MKNNMLVEKNQHPCNVVSSNKYDWTSVRIEYVEGYADKEGNQKWPTMKELSLKHGIPNSYLRRIASAEKWKDEKQNYITNYEHARHTERIKHLAKKSIKFDENCILIAEKGIQRIKDNILNAEKIIEEDGVKVIMPVEELELLAKTLEKFQKIGRLALGSSTDNISKTLKTGQERIPFAEGLDTVMKQVASNPDLLKKIELEYVD